MKKLILILAFIPFTSIAQNTKTDKVLNQVNSVTEVAGNVIGIFKKNKNKDNTDNKTDTKSNNKNTTNTVSAGTFPVNTKPEDILSSVYKCTYKNFDEYTKRCVWKPTATEINNLKQNNQDEYNDWLSDPKLMFATEVSDSTLTFKQDGIDNIVIATSSDSYSSDDKNISFGGGGFNVGFVRFQTTDGKTMKLVSNDNIIPLNGWFSGAEVLKIDEDNIFYNVSTGEGGTAHHSVSYENIYSLDGKLLLTYIKESYQSGEFQGYSEMKIDETNKLIKIVEPHITTDKKGKVIKETYKTIETYKYGNGTITEIKQPAATAKTTKKK